MDLIGLIFDILTDEIEDCPEEKCEDYDFFKGRKGCIFYCDRIDVMKKVKDILRDDIAELIDNVGRKNIKEFIKCYDEFENYVNKKFEDKRIVIISKEKENSDFVDFELTTFDKNARKKEVYYYGNVPLCEYEILFEMLEKVETIKILNYYEKYLKEVKNDKNNRTVETF